MSLSSIEEEAERIIKEAEKRAEEILRSARSEAERILKSKVEKPLPDDVVNNVRRDYELKVSELRKIHEERLRVIRERYERKRDELINEYLRHVLGL